MSSWTSYPSVYNLGHRLVKDIFNDPVVIQEKVDGSQFSFGLFIGEATEEESLRFRSKGATIHPDAPDKMFAAGVEAVKEVEALLHPGWTYRGEYLSKPKHNTAHYTRIPTKHIALFDISVGEEEYLDIPSLEQEASRLGFEAVPILHYGKTDGGKEFLERLLQRESFLGGSKIEGIVIKNYSQFGPDKKVLMAKYVSEAFKEAHKIEWKNTSPGKGDVLDTLVLALRTEARWAKAVQHLREQGLLEDSPKDIGLLFKEVPKDIRKEEEEHIKQVLFAWAWPRVQRSSTYGLAEWYKQKLLEKQFEKGEAT